MRIPGRLVPFVLIAALAAVAGAALGSIELTSDESSRALLADGGTVCVQGTGSLTDVESEVEAVRRAFASELGLAIEMVYGCPRTDIFDAAPPLSRAELNRAVEDAAAVVREPEPFIPRRAFVYVVPSDLYAEYFGDALYIRGVAQFFCSGHSCAADGVALYVRDGVTTATLSAALREVAQEDGSLRVRRQRLLREVGVGRYALDVVQLVQLIQQA